MMDWYLQSPLDNQLYYSFEVSFPRWQGIWVDIFPFEMSEPGLYGAGRLQKE